MKSATPEGAAPARAAASLLGHVLAAAAPLGAAHTVVVVGARPGRRSTAHLAEIAPGAVAGRPGRAARHRPRRPASRWTRRPATLDGHGASCVPGDAPLLRAETLRRARRTRTPTPAHAAHRADRRGRRPDRATAGSCATPTARSPAIVEERTPTPTQRAIREINAGVYAFDAARAARRARPARRPTTPRARSTCTDVIGAARRRRARRSAARRAADADETAGVQRPRAARRAAPRAQRPRCSTRACAPASPSSTRRPPGSTSTVTLEPDVDAAARHPAARRARRVGRGRRGRPGHAR